MSRGTTIIEVMISVFVLGIVLLVVALLYKTALRSCMQAYTNSNILNEISAICSDTGKTKSIVTHIRSAEKILTAQPQKITFEVRSDTITFELAGNSLIKKSKNGDKILSANVESFELTYFRLKDNFLIETFYPELTNAIQMKIRLKKNDFKNSFATCILLRKNAK